MKLIHPGEGFRPAIHQMNLIHLVSRRVAVNTPRKYPWDLWFRAPPTPLKTLRVTTLPGYPGEGRKN